MKTTVVSIVKSSEIFGNKKVRAAGYALNACASLRPLVFEFCFLRPRVLSVQIACVEPKYVGFDDAVMHNSK